MAAQKNLAVEINKIRDEKYKNQLVEKLETYTKDIKYAILGAFKSKSKDSVQGLMVKSTDRIVNAIDLLTGELKRILTTPVAAPQDSQLTEALTSATTEVVAEETKTTAEAANPALLNALTSIKDTIEVGNEKIVATEKAQIANQNAIENAKRQEILLGNGVKQTVENKKEKIKDDKPKFPFDFKQFMGGLGKILSGILNPIALVISFVSHLLPYVILAIAFFKGFWSKLEDPIKEKIIETAITIGKYALIAFAVFKGPAILIKTLTLAYHTARMIYLTAKWVKDMILWAFDMQAKTTEHSLKIGSIIFEKGLTLIQHAMEMALKAFKFVLAVMEFTIIAAAVLVIIGLVVLLIVGIGVLLYKFGDQIKEMISNILDIFKEIGGFIYDAVIGTVKLLVDTVVNLVVGLVGGLVEGLVNGFKWLLGGGNETKTEDVNKKPDKVDIANGVTLDAFNKAISAITEPLEMMSLAVGTWAEIEMAKMLNPVNSPFGQMATAVGAAVNYINNNPSIKNADKTDSSINYSNINTETSVIEPEDIKKVIDSLATLATNSKNILSKMPGDTNRGGFLIG